MALIKHHEKDSTGFGMPSQPAKFYSAAICYYANEL